MSRLLRAWRALVAPARPASGLGARLSDDWAPTHRHRKGGLYRFLGVGCAEATRTKVALYDDAEGTIWVRDLAEFRDGRFAPLPEDAT